MSSEIRKLVPVLKKVCDSFGDKMNSDFFQVMLVLISEQPWYKLLKTGNGFSQGRAISPQAASFPTQLCLDVYKEVAGNVGLLAGGVYGGSRSSCDDPWTASAGHSLLQRGGDGREARLLSGGESPIEGVSSLPSLHTRIIASIRGTQVELDVLRDLIIQPSRLNGGLVHRGMRDEADDVITLLKPHIDTAFIHHPDYHLVLTGHSLGAGAAAIASLILQTSYPSIKAYCYACPSCVSAELLPQLAQSVVSVMNMHDLVPRMNSSAMHGVRDALERVGCQDVVEVGMG